MTGEPLPPITELMIEAATLHGLTGDPPLNQMEGLWSWVLDDGTVIHGNGHEGVTLRTSLDAEVPPFHMLFTTADGWPLALVGPFGGSVIGETTEDRLIDAVRATIARLEQDR